MANNSKEEPKTAPQSDRWYDLVLGPSFKDDSSNKYCTLRYEFKPASIDKSKGGTLQKNKENRASVEFYNNQLGKPKVTFEGSSEDYKENDAVLFFDGETLRLDRLHRAVKQLRHRRQPGESAASAQSSLSVEPRLSPIGKDSKSANAGRNFIPGVPVEVERIEIGEHENPGTKSNEKDIAKKPSPPQNSPAASLGPKNEVGDDHQDIDFDEIFGACTPEHEKPGDEKLDTGFYTNMRPQQDTDEEIANVDDSGDEGEKGPNAAEALRAQVNAEEKVGQSSSSSSSSGSGSSSGSSSTSSDSGASDEDTVSSV